SVSQYDAIQISQGQRAEVKIKGLDKTYEGTVSSIGEAAEISFTGTNKEAKVNVEVSISNPDDKIKAGYEADVDIVLVETKEAISISFEALEEDQEGKSFIYVVQNGKAVKRYIKIGTETEFDIQVLEGLKENDTYIKNPPAALKEGDKVRATGGK
ncbi:MAG: HlyD family efflux transporter periplasmic adaptor subunit, partial [Lutisporaceae bacterium]